MCCCKLSSILNTNILSHDFLEIFIKTKSHWSEDTNTNQWSDTSYNYLMITFVKCEESFISYDFLKTVSNTIIHFVCSWLSLKSDFDDFERLHDENLRPACIRRRVPATIPLKKAKKRSAKLMKLINKCRHSTSYPIK